jgi:hypothetical protein
MFVYAKVGLHFAESCESERFLASSIFLQISLSPELEANKV